MPTVIARLEPKSDAHDAVLDVLREHVPLVHAEAGCDLYSVHSDGRIIVIVESWETGSALKSHATGPGWRLGHGQVRKRRPALRDAGHWRRWGDGVHCAG